MALAKVYTFGPTFRAENSQTTRHLAEFWMCEPEWAFSTLDELMDNAEGLVTSVHKRVAEACDEELAFFEEMYGHKSVLYGGASEKSFARISYDEAVDKLQNSGVTFEKPVVRGGDLSSEHEKWIAEVYAGGIPVLVHHYPASLKPFYVRDNEAFDLLVPGIGELVGGSMREERHDVLLQKMTAKGLSLSSYQWYLDLRKFGGSPHGGYGLGFERLVRMLTGLDNIRDVIPVPRFPHHCPM
jgi:asparaginyl-tRNA synthetase